MRGGPAQLAELCLKNDVDTLYAFGSRAAEAQEALAGHRAGFSVSSSDLDIGVRITQARTKTVREKADLTVALEDFFDVARVDCVIISEADPFLAANIVRGERLYCRDSHDADEYDLYVLRRAGDLAPLERERLALLERS